MIEVRTLGKFYYEQCILKKLGEMFAALQGLDQSIWKTYCKILSRSARHPKLLYNMSDYDGIKSKKKLF